MEQDEKKEVGFGLQEEEPQQVALAPLSEELISSRAWRTCEPQKPSRGKAKQSNLRRKTGATSSTTFPIQLRKLSLGGLPDFVATRLIENTTIEHEGANDDTTEMQD